jgi:hypothetical protein
MSISLTSSGITFDDGTTQSEKGVTRRVYSAQSPTFNTDGLNSYATFGVSVIGSMDTNSTAYRSVPLIYVSWDYWLVNEANQSLAGQLYWYNEAYGGAGSRINRRRGNNDFVGGTATNDVEFNLGFLNRRPHTLHFSLLFYGNNE